MNKVYGSNKIRICFRNLIIDDYKLFRKNVFKALGQGENTSSKFFQDCLMQLYADALGYENTMKFSLAFQKDGRTSDRPYIEFFNEYELRNIGLSFYIFNKDFEDKFRYYVLDKDDIMAMIQNATEKARAKLEEKYRYTYHYDLKPITKSFYEGLKNKGYKLKGDVFKPHSSEEEQKEFNKALEEYKTAFNDFLFTLRDYNKQSSYLILSKLNTGFYNSECGKLDFIEPMSVVNTDKKKFLSKSLLRQNAFKLNTFVDMYNKNDLLLGLIETADFAEEVGNKARETIKQLYGTYPEMTNSFADLYFAGFLKDKKIEVKYEEEQTM